jgi:guanine deaminase
MTNKFMRLAIESARKGIVKNDGGPFGACIVRNKKVLSVAHNTVLLCKDPTCHAEINAIRSAAKRIHNFNLSGCEIYTTSEPCPMCFAAIYWARISKVYIGIGREVAASYGFDDAHFYNEIKLPIKKRDLPSQFGIDVGGCKKVFAKWKKLGRPLY